MSRGGGRSFGYPFGWGARAQFMVDGADPLTDMIRDQRQANQDNSRIAHDQAARAAHLARFPGPEEKEAAGHYDRLNAEVDAQIESEVAHLYPQGDEAGRARVLAGAQADAANNAANREAVMVNAIEERAAAAELARLQAESDARNARAAEREGAAAAAAQAAMDELSEVSDVSESEDDELAAIDDHNQIIDADAEPWDDIRDDHGPLTGTADGG